MNVKSFPWIKPILVGLVIVTGFLSCRQKPEVIAANVFPFTVTNVTFPEGGSEWIVKQTNGVSVCYKDHEVDVYFATDSAVRLSFDSITRLVTNCVFEKPDGFIFDFNGDGIPDERRINTNSENELFYKGDWHKFHSIGNHKVIVDLDGKDTVLSFDGKKWNSVAK